MSPIQFPNCRGCLLPLSTPLLPNPFLKPSSNTGFLILDCDHQWDESRKKYGFFSFSPSPKKTHSLCFQQRQGGRGFLILKLSAHLLLWLLEQAEATTIWKLVYLCQQFLSVNNICNWVTLTRRRGGKNLAWRF